MSDHSNRPNQKASTLTEVIDILKGDTSKPNSHEMIWVGRNYSKANLIRDLEEIRDSASKHNLLKEKLSNDIKQPS